MTSMLVTGRSGRRVLSALAGAVALVGGDLGCIGLPSAPVLAAGEPNTFDAPRAMALGGADLFVANGGGYSVTEVDAATGALVRVISGPQYMFGIPDAMALDGSDLFVASAGHPYLVQAGGSVTEVDAAAGVLVRVISGPQYKFDDPSALTLGGADLFVPNFEGASVTEVNASTGALVRMIPGPHQGPARCVGACPFAVPLALALGGADLFVANLGNSGASSTPTPPSITVVDAATGALERVISGTHYEFDWPGALAPGGGDLFVANNGGNSVTEVVTATGALVRVISGSS